MCIRDSYSDVPEFRLRLHREVIDETYPKLHELLRPLSQEDIDRALCVWNGNIEDVYKRQTKLCAMTDEDFSQLELYPDFDQ